MSSSDSENLTNSIDNLKLYALSTHEELKSLHSRTLFENFSRNQFEMLLEDMKNGTYDENKWGIQKRVEWHVLNSLKLNEPEHQRQVKEMYGKFSHSEFRKGVYTNTNVLNECEASMNFFRSRNKNIWPYIHPEKFSFQKEHEYENVKKLNMQKKSIIMPARQRFVHYKVPNKDKGLGIDQTDSPSMFTYLEMVPIPCVNILPLSKDTLPSLNIEPSVTIDQLSRKNRYDYHSHRKRLSNSVSNLQTVKNVSVDIPPLHKQKQASVNVSPNKIRNRNFPNQGVYEYKHSNVSSEENQTMDSVSRRDDQKTHLDLNTNASNCKERANNKNLNEFDSDRFIERLEERLCSTFPSRPNIKFVTSKSGGREHSVSVKKDESLAPEEASQLEVFSSSKTSKIPISPTIKNTETQTSFFASVDKYVQTSKTHDDRHDNFNPKKEKNRSKPDKQIDNDNQGLSQNSSEKFSQSSGTGSKRVSFELDQLSSSNSQKENKDDKIFTEMSDNNDAAVLSHGGIKSISTNNNNNNKNNKDKESLVSEIIDEPDNKKLHNYDSNKIEKDIVNSGSNTISSSSVSKTPEELFSHSRENIFEQEPIQDLNEFLDAFDDKQSLYSHTFLSDSAENKLLCWEDIQKAQNNFSSSSGKKSDGAPESEGVNILINQNNYEVLSQEETVLPSIEIGDVTISEGEIEFEASISDIQPCNRIAIKFSTKDLGIVIDKSSESRILVDKETQTSISCIADNSNLENITGGSSFSEGVILKLESDNHVSTNDEISAESEPSDETLENVSEGELIGKVTPIMEDQEKKTLLIENEKLLQRLSDITGRFVRK